MLNITSERRFWLLWAALSVLVTAPLWVGGYMPMVDIPQHAAQLAIGQHWDDPAYGYHDIYQVNQLVNHVAAYAVVHMLAAILPLAAAIKGSLTLFVWALPASVLFLLRATGGDRRWAILCFPLAYGFCTYWGFLNYVLAIPLGVLLVGQAARYALQPSKPSALGLFALSGALFVSHVLVLAFAGAVAGAIVLARSAGWRAKVMGAAALAAVLPVVAVWWAAVQQATPPAETGTKTALSLGLSRLYDLLSYQVGIEPSVPSALTGGLLLAGPFLLGARPAREWWRWIPCVMSVLAVMFVPLHALGVAFLYGRFAIFVLPSLLFALEPGPSPLRGSGGWVSVLVALQLLTVVWTFRAFDDESAGLHEVLDRLPPHKRVLYFDTERQSAASFGWAYLHFGSYYQVERGGPVDFSFAKFFPNRYRYKDEQRPHLPDDIEWFPLSFRWAQHGGNRYDFILVKGGIPRVWFPPEVPAVGIVARSGPWVAIGRVPDRGAVSARDVDANVAADSPR